MKNNEIVGILVDVYNQKIEKHVIKYDSDDDYYEQKKKLLRCSFMDAKRVAFKNVDTYIFFDDLGKIREDREQIPGVLLVNKNTGAICDYISGNCFIEKLDMSIEDTVSFSDLEITWIMQCKENVKFVRDDTKINSALVLVSRENWVNILHS